MGFQKAPISLRFVGEIMIKQLNGHITENQINVIVEIIKSQYLKYLNFTGKFDYNGLFADEYSPHKHQHNISWAISSAFPSNTIVANNLYVERLIYGRGHIRPSLSNDYIELHILNKTTDFKAKYLEKRYAYNSNDFINQKLFAYIKFSVKNDRLVNISLCLPDEKGVIVAEQELLNKKVLELLAA